MTVTRKAIRKRREDDPSVRTITVKLPASLARRLDWHREHNADSITDVVVAAMDKWLPDCGEGRVEPREVVVVERKSRANGSAPAAVEIPDW